MDCVVEESNSLYLSSDNSNDERSGEECSSHSPRCDRGEGMVTSAFIDAFQAQDVPQIEQLLAAGARLSVLPEGAGGGLTRRFCDEYRRASRLRLALAAGARRGAEVEPLLHLTAALLQSGAHEQPLLEWHDADDCEAYLPDDAVSYAHCVVRVAHPSQRAVAALILQAAAPWSPSSHHLWPVHARAFVHALLWIGKQLHEAHSMPLELWSVRIMPRVVRRCGVVPGSELEEEAIYHGMEEVYRDHFPWRYF